MIVCAPMMRGVYDSCTSSVGEFKALTLTSVFQSAGTQPLLTSSAFLFPSLIHGVIRVYLNTKLPADRQML